MFLPSPCLQVRHPLSGHVVAAPEHQAKVAFRVLQKHLVPARALSCCCGGSMKGLLLIRYFGFSAFLIPDICSLFFRRDKERDILLPRERILLASLQTVKSHKVKFRATRSGRAGVQGFLAVQSR